MPIVQVEALPQQPGVEVEETLAALCNELAALLGEDPSGTWATWRTLEHYIEGSEASEEGNVFVVYEEAQPGRLHSDGKVVGG